MWRGKKRIEEDKVNKCSDRSIEEEMMTDRTTNQPTDRSTNRSMRDKRPNRKAPLPIIH